MEYCRCKEKAGADLYHHIKACFEEKVNNIHQVSFLLVHNKKKYTQLMRITNLFLIDVFSLIHIHTLQF